jgi:hypothetical protein
MSFNNITVTPISRIVNVCDQWERINDAISDLLDAAKAHVNGSDDVHPASELDNDSGVSGSKIDNALDTLQSLIDAIETGDSNALIGVYKDVAGGVVNAYTTTITDLTLFNELFMLVRFDTPNTGPATMTLNATGTKDINTLDANGDLNDLVGGELNGWVPLIYDLSNTKYIALVKTDRKTSEQMKGEGLTEAFRKWNYLHNTNTHNDLYFQDYTVFTSGAGTLSNDPTNTYWGDNSVKLLNNDNGASAMYFDLESITLDFTKSINGESIDDNGYIIVKLFLSDQAMTTSVVLTLSTGATIDANSKQYSITGLATGNNYVAVKKSAFVTNGSGAWSGLQSIRFQYPTNAGYQNEYVSFQLVQLVRVDPDDSTQYSYFQKQIADGVYQNTITWAGTEESILGEENGVVRWKLLGTSTDLDAYKMNVSYSYKDDFVAHANYVISNAGEAPFLIWYNADGDYAMVYFQTNVLYLEIKRSSVTSQSSQSLTPAVGSTVGLSLIRNGNVWSMQYTLNGVIQNTEIESITQAFTGLSGILCLGGFAGNDCYIESATITSTKVADHANTSDLAYRILQPSCRVYNDANISVNNASATALTFNSERWDNNGMHDTSINTGRLTCREKGIYSIKGCVEFASDATGNRKIFIRLNGGNSVATSNIGAINGDTSVLCVDADYELDIGDYVELVVVQSSGGALNVLSTSNYTPEFMMTKKSD